MEKKSQADGVASNEAIAAEKSLGKKGIASKGLDWSRRTRHKRGLQHEGISLKVQRPFRTIHLPN
jgi:hypothetical protein